MFAKIKSATTKVKWLVVAVIVVFGVSLSILVNQPPAYSQPVPGYCAAPYKINWPTINPVWSICWTPPSNSSGINGSGLELTYVFYKGKKVFERAHLPVLNVTYDNLPGACGGGPDRSYRDWQDEEVRFEANNVIQAGYAEPTLPPKTVCNLPGADIGSFTGVAAEKKADRLILTTQLQAGWYRYTMKWTFYPNGNIEPRFAFSAVNNPCTTKPHFHHAYWRFDFDIEGSGNDKIEEFNGGAWATKTTEFNRLKASGRKWRVKDGTTNRGYEIIPASNDGTATNDAFAVSDVWGLKFNNTQLDDGGSVGGSDRAQMNAYLNGENINGQDVVLWYRAGYKHANGNPCEYVGPLLKPLGAW